MALSYQEIIDKYYPPGTSRRVILMRHCSQVADLALEIACKKCLRLPPEDIREAAMLHDIGIFLTSAVDIGCDGDEPYIMHGVLGAELLRKEGVSEQYARVAERHTGAGITAADIRQQGLPLPIGDYVPESILERLVCYADKFYSKGGDMKRKPLDRVIRSMERFSPDTLERFMDMHKEFSISDG